MEKSKLKSILEAKRARLTAINPINKTIDETLSITVDETFNQSSHEMINQSSDKSIDRTVDEAIYKSVDEQLDESSNQTIDRTINETSYQSINLKGQPLMVYHYLRPRTGSPVRPQQLSDELRISKDSVRSALSFLKKNGFIEQHEFKVGKGGYSVYRILK